MDPKNRNIAKKACINSTKVWNNWSVPLGEDLENMNKENIEELNVNNVSTEEYKKTEGNIIIGNNKQIFF
ncbi:19429_t:CDS:2 [Gigaspora margarita]|uniref:19429_t:CDS:1 n=1 Tax=Gigaspora margarita TaxID=4874 RepID=A0ABM8VWL7_GIGMA|nr:19429_t:CDS:2 [Gigaspora margarita]